MCQLYASEINLELNDDELVSFKRFEMLHKIACEKNDTQIYQLLFSNNGLEKLKILEKEELQQLVNTYPEVIGITLKKEISHNELINLVGDKMGNYLVTKDDIAVKIFEVKFILKNNGSANSYLFFKNGVFYKAVL